MMDEVLLKEHFEPYVGRTVHFEGTHYAFPLERVMASPYEAPPGVARQPFTLIFVGPEGHDVMPEGAYDCAIENGPRYRMHINPIHTPAPNRQEYQAVFS